jgi:xanthine dehydrogenase accessory factor
VAHGLTPERAENFFCPIGEPIGSNHPHEIALSIAAQLLRVRDALTPAPQTFMPPR